MARTLSNACWQSRLFCSFKVSPKVIEFLPQRFLFHLVVPIVLVLLLRQLRLQSELIFPRSRQAMKTFVEFLLLLFQLLLRFRWSPIIAIIFTVFLFHLNNIIILQYKEIISILNLKRRITILLAL